MRKKILAILLCFFSVFAFCGCASINYSLTIESSGVVTQTINLQFSEAEIVKAGKTLNNFMLNVENISNQVVQNSYNNFVVSHNLDEELKTYSGDTVEFSQIVNFVTENMDPNNGKAKIEWKRNGDAVYCKISLKFLNLYAYRYFNDIYPDTEDENETIREDHLFYVKDIDYTDSPYNDISNNSIAKYFMEYFNNYFSYDDIKCSFTYSTPNSKLYSDADDVEENSSGNVVHTWYFTTQEINKDGGSKMKTYSIKYRAYVWYINAVAISLIAGLVIYIVCKVRENRRRKCQSHFLNSDLEYFKKTSQEIVEANRQDKNDNAKE